MKIWLFRLFFGFIAMFILVETDLRVVEAQSPSGRIAIPSLEIDAEIVPIYIRRLPQGATWDTRWLYGQVGHLTGTGWFGQNKNVVLGGHSESIDRQPDIFYDLGTIEVGAEIVIQANDTTYTYLVTSLEWVEPTDLSSVLPTGHDQLTLITCDTDSFDDDNGTYKQRLVIRALPA